MKHADVAGLTLDTGALLALDRLRRPDVIQGWLERTRRRGGSICIPTAVVAQAWRSARQVRLAMLLKSEDVEFEVISLDIARLVGRKCASSGHPDVVDVHVAMCAKKRNHAVMTSEPDDIEKVDPSLPLIRI